jgi:glyoxylase-like metal-dependent hydrolase (beta-lactamase superfamily II)
MTDKNWILETSQSRFFTLRGILQKASGCLSQIRLEDRSRGFYSRATLFVGAVGRPDLPGKMHESAGQLYDSLKGKILELPETLEIYPAHFSGSVCGAGMSGKPMSTIAFEKRWNASLNLDRAAFVEKITSAIPPKPAEMESILRANQGRA